MDLIGQTKLRSEFNVLFCNYSDADIKAVYGCDGVPWLNKHLDLIFINSPMLKVIKVNKTYVGFFNFHAYRFKGTSRTIKGLKTKLAKDLRRHDIQYYHIDVKEIG